MAESINRTVYIAVGVALTLSALSIGRQWRHDSRHDMIDAYLYSVGVACTKAGVDVPMPPEKIR